MKLGFRIGTMVLALLPGLTDGRCAAGDDSADAVFNGPVPQLQIEIPGEGLKVLRAYKQVWRQQRPERVDVRVRVIEGDVVYTNVALHLKGSFSFQPIDDKPSMTLNFEKFAPGQAYHGLTKIHLNNSVQDPSYLCESLARALFQSVGVPSPRATPALVTLNGRELGVSVLVEGANKRFVKRHFASTEGNLYDGGSGGDVTKPLETDSGKDPTNRSDLTNLVQAARTKDPDARLARMAAVLDIGEFTTFAATEAFLVHWDGYAIGCNNYRVFHDVARDKMVFIPHGLDQLFGVSSSINLSLTPPFKGMVAKALFSIPASRERYLVRVGELSTNEFSVASLHARVDRMASRLRDALKDHRGLRRNVDAAVENLKQRIARRAASVAVQLRNLPQPAPLAADNSVRLGDWTFKPGSTRTASGERATAEGRPLLTIVTRGPESTGSWRSTVLLGAGHYEFTGTARTEELPITSPGTNGVMLRISGERSTHGISIAPDWTRLSYEFDVRGVADVELACEYRGPEGRGAFDLETIRLIRRGPPAGTKDPDAR